MFSDLLVIVVMYLMHNSILKVYILSLQGHDGFSTAGVSEIHTQELAAKISENEKLHMKVCELWENQLEGDYLEGKQGKISVDYSACMIESISSFGST